MTALRHDPDWHPTRCTDHQLVACRRCATAQPGINRHWPNGPTPPRPSSERPPFRAVANRADRRAAAHGGATSRGFLRGSSW